MIIKHKAGRKRESRFWPCLIPCRRLSYSLIFTENSKYEFEFREDQNDYRKAPGVKLRLFNSHFISAMPGYRYSVDEDVFEVSPYFHSDITNDTDIYKIVGQYDGYVLRSPYKFKIGEPINILIDTYNDSFVFRINNRQHPFYFSSTVFNLFWQTRSWFGGTNAYDKKDVSYEIHNLSRSIKRLKK